jgi:hypothetical protein
VPNLQIGDITFLLEEWAPTENGSTNYVAIMTEYKTLTSHIKATNNKQDIAICEVFPCGSFGCAPV